MTQKLPWLLECFNYANPFYYAFRFQLQEIFQGLEIVCAQNEIQKGFCIFTTGEQVLKYLKMDDQNLPRDMLSFVGVCMFYRMVAWVVIVIRVNRYGRKHSVVA